MIPAGRLRKHLIRALSRSNQWSATQGVSRRKNPMGNPSGNWDSDWIHDVYTHDHTKPAKLRTWQTLAGRLGQHGLVGSNQRPAITEIDSPHLRGRHRLNRFPHLKLSGRASHCRRLTERLTPFKGPSVSSVVYPASPRGGDSMTQRCRTRRPRLRPRIQVSESSCSYQHQWGSQ